MFPRVAQAGFNSLMSAMDILLDSCSHSFRDHTSLSTEYRTISNCKFVPDAEIRSDDGGSDDWSDGQPSCVMRFSCCRELSLPVYRRIS